MSVTHVSVVVGDHHDALQRVVLTGDQDQRQLIAGVQTGGNNLPSPMCTLLPPALKVGAAEWCRVRPIMKRHDLLHMMPRSGDERGKCPRLLYGHVQMT